MFARSRLLLIGKSALAAALAWLLAPLVPFVGEEYAYYAPLGALLSMHPTLARSFRSGVETVAGLALGIAVGFGGHGLLLLGSPGVLAVAAVAGAGVLLGGIPRLGSGRDWVPIAALFTLVLGGGRIEEYSAGYLVHVAFGLVVGMAVNALVWPPLSLGVAERHLSTLRDEVATVLRELADLLGAGDPDGEALRRRAESLGATAGEVRDAVREGEESRRGNLRGARARTLAADNHRRMRALDRTVFFVQDLADVLARGEVAPTPARPDDGPELATALRRAADLVATPVAAAESRERLGDAERALAVLERDLERRAADGLAPVAAELSAAGCVRRIVDASRPFVADPG